MPTWNPETLERHYQKRTHREHGCFAEALGVNGTLTKAQYVAASEAAVRNAWGELLVEHRDHPGERRYHVDDRLILAITDPNGDKFTTCYHEHLWGIPEFRGGHRHVLAMSVGQRRGRYQQKTREDRGFQQVRWLRRA